MDTRNFTSRISFFYVLLLVAAVILSVFCINSDYEKPFGTKKDDIISSLTIDSSYKTAKSTSYTLKTREIIEDIRKRADKEMYADKRRSKQKI